MPCERYDHWHMPCAESFLNSPKTYAKTKTKVIQCMINCTQHLLKIKPANINFCRIVCLISNPNLWDSQIIIFYDKNYYDNFFMRNDISQRWTIIPNKSMKTKRYLSTIPEFIEIGYLEEIIDEDSGIICVCELWFYGELDPRV